MRVFNFDSLFSAFLHFCNAQEALIMLDLIVLHGEFSLLTVRGYWAALILSFRMSFRLISIMLINIIAWGPQVKLEATFGTKFIKIRDKKNLCKLMALIT